MTRDRDIERVLDMFYAEGPSEMPDRVYLGIVDRIAVVQQRRLALLTRLLPMNGSLRLAAAAALVVALAGVGALSLIPTSSVGPHPSPTPSTAASQPAVVGLPATLSFAWVGAPRTVPETATAPARVALRLSDHDAQFRLVGGTTQFGSTAALVASDRIRLTLRTPDAGCHRDDVGEYAFALSADQKTLTLTPRQDACQPRAAALAGDWIRSDCPDPNSWCLGDLSPGSHVSTTFQPIDDPVHWTYGYGRFSYDVPDGWTNFQDCFGCYQLGRKKDPGNTGIFLFSDVVAHGDYGTACQDNQAQGVGRTAEAIATYLAGRPGITATPRARTTLGGLTGVMFDISVKSSWKPTCPFSNGQPIVATFTDSDPASGGMDWNVAGDGHTRLILLDLPDGRALLIDIEAPSKATFDDLLPDAMQVVNTFQFRR